MSLTGWEDGLCVRVLGVVDLLDLPSGPPLSDALGDAAQAGLAAGWVATMFVSGPSHFKTSAIAL